MTSISIITATYNAAATITGCLQSVASQTHPADHILIDGASTDKTLDMISPFTLQSSLSIRVFSEPDCGIYDAMNKGIAMATGTIIGILNADDFYASPLVLEKIARVFEDPSVICCYGDLEYVRDSGSRFGVEKQFEVEYEPSNVEHRTSNRFDIVRYWQSGPYNPDKFFWGWMPPHPTFFVRRSVYERYGAFRLDMGSAADYELMLRLLLKHGLQAAYIPEVLVRMRVGGTSNASLQGRIKANRMDRRAWEVNDLQPYAWTLLMKPLRKIGQWLVRP